MNSAVLSDCGLYRYRLDRDIQEQGLVIAYFGINPSTADALIDDHTVRKWRGFTLRNGGRKFVVGNVFSYRATDVNALATIEQPCGPDHIQHLGEIIEVADVLVPCWGVSAKVPASLHYYIKNTLHLLLASGKPVLHFGTTKAGDPLHPLTLGYDTPLTPWGAV
jgi:hypothetical protein